MNAKVFLLLPALPVKEPLQMYHPVAKTDDQQNGSGYFHNACKTLPVKKSETILISLFFLISCGGIFAVYFL
ncbi:hypothetical protein P8923_18730 [Bacillus atrophaeus]|uniref:hypothetical protein n=1 Tax=Bacillus atrophaeus TaxID=1452 RepID=UPI002DB6006C|nr:hypothetical protein [Bacillus atrophaeus]MEC0992905.1 hypothetical protein [Bacillus atrophaeus]